MSGSSEDHRNTEEPASAGGPTMFELDTLPGPQRRIMRLVLRKGEISYDDLKAAIEALPAADQFSVVEMDAALEDLTKHHLITVEGSSDHGVYKATIRRRAPSALSKRLWDALDGSGDVPLRRRRAQDGEEQSR